MGTIVCQTCNKPIVFFEGDKVTKLYAEANTCKRCQEKTK
ncbi:GapA-binding peptide SR1P [Halalkalibacter urbisdiaboli]|nr:GapA-binding peptide SR1P [Halalkalibacter urbisdiaboli]